MARYAIATMACGTAFQEQFDRYVYPFFFTYCHTHGIELVVFREPVDLSPRAQQRSVAWQKLLVAEHPLLSSFDFVAWIDADIVLNPSAPNIFQVTPLDEQKISVVVYEDHKYSQEKYKACGFIDPPSRGTNTGVFLFSPRVHASTLRSVYDDFEENGIGDYENTALSYHIFKNNLDAPLDERFNVNFPLEIFTRYNFMHHAQFRTDDELKSYVTNTIFGQSWFLHFIGIQGSREYLKHVHQPSRYFGTHFL